MELHKCTQAGCNIQEDKKCLEGHSVESCPYYLAYGTELETDSDKSDIELGSINEAVLHESEYVKVYNANALNFEECEKFIRTRAAILIVLAGKVKCGKTTIITTLIQSFQQSESFANFEFAGSDTLIGFEQRCHPSRLLSMASHEDTTRTAIFNFDNHLAAQTFLHLRLKKKEKFYDLLIADISGEIFDELTTSTELCKKLNFLHRCDNFTLMLDSDALSELSKRGTVKTKSISILRSLIDAEMIAKSCHIQILFSKWDVLLQKDNVEYHKEFIKAINSKILEEFLPTHPNLTVLEIASRPVKSSGLKMGHGLDILLDKWTSASAFLSLPERSETVSPKTGREFLKYNFINNGGY